MPRPKLQILRPAAHGGPLTSLHPETHWHSRGTRHTRPMVLGPRRWARPAIPAARKGPQTCDGDPGVRPDLVRLLSHRRPSKLEAPPWELRATILPANRKEQFCSALLSGWKAGCKGQSLPTNSVSQTRSHSAAACRPASPAWDLHGGAVAMLHCPSWATVPGAATSMWPAPFPVTGPEAKQVGHLAGTPAAAYTGLSAECSPQS